MARAKPWFRIHNTIVDNPKIQRLPDSLVRPWLNLVALANGNGGSLPAIGDVAFRLRLTDAKCETLIETFLQRRLFDKTDDGIVPHDWNDWQYQSDVSTERVKQFRERQRNVSETPDETDQRQSRDRAEKTDANASVARKPRTQRRTRLADDWKPSQASIDYATAGGLTREEIERLAAEFVRYWRGPDAKNRGIKGDWEGTWHNNIDRNTGRILANRSRGGQPGSNRQGPGSVVDVVARLKAKAGGEGDLSGGGVHGGADFLRAAKHEGSEPEQMLRTDSHVVESDDAERMFRAARGDEADHGLPAGAGTRPGSPVGAVRAETGGVPGGRGAESADDSAEHEQVVADMGGTEGPAGSIQRPAPQAAASDDDLEIPAFLDQRPGAALRRAG